MVLQQRTLVGIVEFLLCSLFCIFGRWASTFLIHILVLLQILTVMKITVAVTGASGSIYARILLERLVAQPQVSQIYVVFTKSGESVSQYEESELMPWLDTCQKVSVLGNDDFYTPIASGSSAPDAMVVIPCSMGSAARIAAGVSLDLVSRAADVMLKENRLLLLCTRESPLSLIHLRNLTALREAGAQIVPLCPSFYSRPISIEELAGSMVDRILALLHIPNQNAYKWCEKPQ